MRAQTQSENPVTMVEHLRVQHEIEVLAYRCWHADGFTKNTMLDYWLRAEDKVLSIFLKRRLAQALTGFSSRISEFKSRRAPTPAPAIKGGMRSFQSKDLPADPPATPR
jgi:hypothetical protein